MASNKSQLFRLQPTRELTEHIVQCFGLKGLEDTTNFSKSDIKLLSTVKKIVICLYPSHAP